MGRHDRTPTSSAVTASSAAASGPASRLSLLLAEAGVQPRASWVIAEGADACRMMRSIPLAKAMENSLLAYGQNGEAMRPAQGYPLRLINPGWEGNTNVKWLHSLKLTDQPYMARDETSKYSDLMPDGKAQNLHLRDGSEVGHHVSVRRADAAGARVCTN